jgi:hypothetical protein
MASNQGPCGAQVEALPLHYVSFHFLGMQLFLFVTLCGQPPPANT